MTLVTNVAKYHSVLTDTIAYIILKKQNVIVTYKKQTNVSYDENGIQFWMFLL